MEHTIKNLEKLKTNFDLRLIESEIAKKLDYKVQFTLRIFRDGLLSRLDLTSNDLVPYSGIFKNIYRSLTIETFSGGMIQNDKMWMSLSFYFQYKNGGYNRTTVMEFDYNIKTKKYNFN